MRWLLTILVLTGCNDPVADEVPCSGVQDPDLNWAPAFDAADLGAFFSVWGRCHDDVWIVGGQPEAGVAVHYDGVDWTPADPPPGAVLHWVHGAGDATFFVGDDGRALRRTGETFEALDTGVDVPLWGAFAVSPDDVWVAGGDPSDPDGGGVLLHWDGSAWEVTATDAVMFKVWGTGANDLVAVGTGGAILRWDGAAWNSVASGTTEDLISLWGRSGSDIVAMGGRGQGVGVRWDGVAWTPFELLTPGMSGTWMASDGAVTAAGSRGTLAAISPDNTVVLEDSGSPHLLHGAFGFDGGPRFAVGGSLTRQPPWEGVVLIDP